MRLAVTSVRLARTRVRLAAFSVGWELVPFYLGAVGAHALRETGGEPDEDGWSMVELPVESGGPALGQLLRFGPEPRVLAPADLRAQVAEAVVTMGACYG